MKTSIHLRVCRADWRLIRKVYGPMGGQFAEKMLSSRVVEVASELRALGITTNSPENQARLIAICNDTLAWRIDGTK